MLGLDILDNDDGNPCVLIAYTEQMLNVAFRRSSNEPKKPIVCNILKNVFTSSCFVCKVFTVFMAYAVGMFITVLLFLAELMNKRSRPRIQDNFPKTGTPLKSAFTQNES